jgi:hypothetical protein
MSKRLETKSIKAWIEGKELSSPDVTVSSGFLYLRWADARISMTGFDKTRDNAQRDGSDTLMFHFCGDWDEPTLPIHKVVWPVKIQFRDVAEATSAFSILAL